MKKAKLVLSLCVCVGIAFSCKSQELQTAVFPLNKRTHEYKILINKNTLDSFGVVRGYSAVVASLSENRFVQVPPDTFQNNPPKGLENELINLTTADLWLEPRDPEVEILPQETGHLKVVDGAWDSYNMKVAQMLDFTHDGLRRAEIKAGTIFLIKKTEGEIYKVRIDHFDKVNEEMSLTYRKLN